MGKSSGSDRNSNTAVSKSKKNSSELYQQLDEYINEQGYFTEINRSNTSFGKSDYIYVSDEKNEVGLIRKDFALKVRISDHSVTNYDRIFGEYHISSRTKNVKKVKKELINLLNFKFRRDQFFFKKNVIQKTQNILETTSPYENDKIISFRMNKAGDKKVYTVNRTYENLVEQWINKKNKRVYTTISKNK